LAERLIANRTKVVVFLALALLGLCGGCAARHAISNPKYTLQEFGNADFLLPPDSAGASISALTEKISLGNLPGNVIGKHNENCSIRDPWFSLYRNDSGDWIVELPLPAAWPGGHLYSDIRPQWNQFLTQLYELEGKRCITPVAYVVAASRIAESVPILANDALFFKYSFGSGGVVTLTSGMRLHINRSIFRPVPGGAETVSNYLGERTIYYQVEEKRGDALALKLDAIHNSAGLKQSAGSQFRDAKLARTFSGARVLRLFLFTLFVPMHERRAALLIGAKDADGLNQATAAIAKHPEIPCDRLTASGTECASLDGTVSMSVDMNVVVNGKVHYFPIGSAVDSALGNLPKDEMAEAVKTLRIERLFRGKYAEVEFNHSSEAFSKLMLFAGDRLSWKTSQ
jgi:hypothetical protein